jgi:hypothetical protein
VINTGEVKLLLKNPEEELKRQFQQQAAFAEPF